MKRDVAEVGDEWKMTARDRAEWRRLGETPVKLAMKKKGKQKSTTGIGASLTPDYRDRGEQRQPGY